MTALYTETQVVATVTRLTPARLDRFIRAEIVIPVQTETGQS